MKAIIFDLGGTLIHYEKPGTDVLKLGLVGLANIYEQASAWGVALPARDEFIQPLARHLLAVIEAAARVSQGANIEMHLRTQLVAQGIGETDAQWQVLRAAYYRPIHALIHMRVGVPETLAALRARGYTLSLASNTFWARDVHDEHLAQYGLLEFFPVRTYSSEIAWIKPHPDFFRAACANAGVRPDETLYVGDRAREDVEGALGAGLTAALLRNPYRAETVDHTQVLGVFDELPELLNALPAD